MKLLSEVSNGLLVIQIQIQAVCALNEHIDPRLSNRMAIVASWFKHKSFVISQKG